MPAHGILDLGTEAYLDFALGLVINLPVSRIVFQL